MDNKGVRPTNAAAWLQYETIEAIAQGAEVVRAQDGQLLARPAAPGASGLASRVSAWLGELNPLDRAGNARAQRAHPTDVLQALHALYGALKGPEKDLLPRSLHSRHPQAAAQELLHNLQSARARVLASRDPRQVIEEALGEALALHPLTEAEAVLGPEARQRIVAEATRFAHHRWTDAFNAGTLSADAAGAAVRRARDILAQRTGAAGAQAASE